MPTRHAVILGHHIHPPGMNDEHSLTWGSWDGDVAAVQVREEAFHLSDLWAFPPV